MKYQFSPAPSLARQSQSSPAVVDILASLVEAPFIWLGRAQDRRRLAELDDHLLCDIGLSRSDADQVASRPFWRA